MFLQSRLRIISLSINGLHSNLTGIKDLPIPAKWFPGGPSFSLSPYPVVDETRKGTGCKDCGDKCSGHYVTDLTTYIDLYSQGKAVRSLPPSQILQDYNKKHESFLESDIDNLARKCLLLPDEVKLWLQHLQQVAENRRKGAEKAKVSRRRMHLFPFTRFTM